MYSVGDALNIEIRKDVDLTKYICNDCGYEFNGIVMKNIRCAVCHSFNTAKKFK